MGLAVVQLFGSRMAGQVAGFLAAILVARAVGPEAFGLYSVAVTIAIILAAVPGGGLDLAVVRVTARHWTMAPERSHNVLFAGGLIRLAAALLLTIIGLVVAWLLQGPLDRAALAAPVACAALAGLAIGMTDYMLATFQARERFRPMFTLNLVGAALKLLPIALLFALGALTLINALAAFIVAVVLTVVVGAALMRSNWAGSAHWEPSAAGELLHFSRWLVPTATLGVLTAGVDVAVLAHLASAETTGIYTSARTLASPLAIVGGTIGAVLLPRLTQLTDRTALYRAARVVGYRVAGLAALAAVGLGIAAPLAVPLVFGAGYSASVPVFQVLVVAYAVEIATWPALIVLLALDRPDITAGLSLLVLGITLGGVILVAPVVGAVGAAGVVLLSRVIVGLLYLAFVWGARPLPSSPDGSPLQTASTSARPHQRSGHQV
jgi:O-antigen/teichoic acid export membrane protein